MRILIGRLSSLAGAKLGRCVKCWRRSFKGAICGWLALFIVNLLWPQDSILRMMWIWPLSFSALWLAHLVTFSSRQIAFARLTGHEPDVEFSFLWHKGCHRRMARVSSPPPTRMEESVHATEQPTAAARAGRTFPRREFMTLLKSAGVVLAGSIAMPILTACSGGSYSGAGGSGGSSGGGQCTSQPAPGAGTGCATGTQTGCASGCTGCGGNPSNIIACCGCGWAWRCSTGICFNGFPSGPASLCSAGTAVPCGF